MWCVPACRECKDTGQCPRGDRPVSLPAPPKPRRSPHRGFKPARTDTIPDVILSGFSTTTATLECGHPTTRDAQIFWSVWRPSPCHFLCLTCDDWKLLRPPIITPLPDIPLF